MAAGTIRILSRRRSPGLSRRAENDHLVRAGYALGRIRGHSAQTIAEFRRHRPDITLMDFRLPRTDGTDVLITVRSRRLD